MPARHVQVLLDWLGLLLKEQVQVEQQREESGYDPDYDASDPTIDPPDCFDPTAWEIVLAAIETSSPELPLSRDEIRAFSAALNHQKRAEHVLGNKSQPLASHPESHAILRKIKAIDFPALLEKLDEESWRAPIQSHATWLAELHDSI